MSYWDISLMATDGDLTARMIACAAQEQSEDPYQWVAANGISVCAQPGWSEAWASALAGGNESPGRDESVITDGMILSGVQAVIGTPPA